MSTSGRGMFRYLQGKTADAIARPATDPCVANPPTRKATKKAKPSSSHCKDG
jgi:hypothetical protein